VDPSFDCIIGIVPSNDYLGEFFLLSKNSDFDYQCRETCFCLFIEKEVLLRILERSKVDFDNVHAAAMVRYLQLLDLLSRDELSDPSFQVDQLSTQGDKTSKLKEPDPESNFADQIHQLSITPYNRTPKNQDVPEVLEKKPQFGLLNLANEFFEQQLMVEEVKPEERPPQKSEQYKDIAEEGHSVRCVDIKKKQTLDTQRLLEDNRTQKSNPTQTQTGFFSFEKGSHSKQDPAERKTEERLTVSPTEHYLPIANLKPAQSNSKDMSPGLPVELPVCLDISKIEVESFKRELDEIDDESIEMEDPIASMEYTDLDPSPDTALRMVEVVSMVTTGEVRPREEEV
jgi:hypothetical protein